MKHRIVVPAIDPAATESFLRNCHSEVMERLIVVDNTDDEAIFKLVGMDVGCRIANGCNAGVATSWNSGVRVALNEGAEFVTLCSTSVHFNGTLCVDVLIDGGLALLRTADLAVSQRQWPYGFESMCGWKLITFGRRTFEEVGLFDEAFWPAYYEDNDYIWRMRCARILEPRGWYFSADNDGTVWHGASRGEHPHFEDFSVRKIPWVGALKYHVTEDASTLKNEDLGITVDFAKLGAYYEKKWGGPPGMETSTVSLVPERIKR